MELLKGIISLLILTAQLFGVGKCFAGHIIKDAQFKCHLENCSKKDAKFHNLKIDYSPNPPVLGQLLTASVSATITEKVTSGYLYTEVNFNNLPPIKETYDLCYILSSATEIECPLRAEDVHYEMSHMLPEVVIPGNYSATITATDQTNSELFCMRGGCTFVN